MLTFSKLGSKGQLGNQMFQIASVIGLADLNGQDCCFPKWKYSKYFKNSLPESTNTTINYLPLKEAFFHHHKWEIENENYDLEGWLQSEKYFDSLKTKKIFQFNSELLVRLVQDYAHILKKKTILIAVRRGDFVNHPFYHQVKFKYYLQAIKYFFSDWEERNLVFTSDDMNYCKEHFSFLKNAYFIESLNAIESMALGTLCDDFIINNSTFSWWIAYLGEKPYSKVVRPMKNFRGSFALNNNDKDFYPEGWLSFDYKKVKMEPRFYLPNIKAKLFEVKFNMEYYGTKYKYQLKQNIKVLIKK